MITIANASGIRVGQLIHIWDGHAPKSRFKRAIWMVGTWLVRWATHQKFVVERADATSITLNKTIGDNAMFAVKNTFLNQMRNGSGVL